MKGILLLSFLFCLVFLHQALGRWQQAQDLEYKNTLLKKDIHTAQHDLKYLARLPNGRPADLESTYRHLEYQTRLFNQYHDLKISLQVSQPDPDSFALRSKAVGERFLIQLSTPSAWPGISQISLTMGVDHLKSMEQYVEVLEFLKNMEGTMPLDVLRIAKKGDGLETDIQLYGPSNDGRRL